MILGISGNRPDKLGIPYNPSGPKWDLLYEKLTQFFHSNDIKKVISGFALGVDQWVVEECLNRNIPYIAAIPFEGQESKWPQSSQEKYHELLSRAEKQVIISEGSYSNDKFQIRNEWIVDNCDEMLFVWNGKYSGGTWNCYKYAISINKTVHNIII